jgi:hypothetical protein
VWQSSSFLPLGGDAHVCREIVAIWTVDLVGRATVHRTDGDWSIVRPKMMYFAKALAEKWTFPPLVAPETKGRMP